MLYSSMAKGIVMTLVKYWLGSPVDSTFELYKRIC